MSDRNERKVICLIGNVLKERYCIVEQIGHGGGGSLYLAKDMELGICRAVKEISIAKKKEARLMQHLNILQYRRLSIMWKQGVLLSDHGIYQGSVAGRTSPFRKTVFFTEILALGKEIARVLEYLHSRKPPSVTGPETDNLMFSETGHLYLIDLGSAMFDHEKEKQICEGTKGYAAPEQYQGYLRPEVIFMLWGRPWKSFAKKEMAVDFYIRIFSCSCSDDQKTGKYRYSDMSVVQKKIQKLENRYRMITWRKRFWKRQLQGF